MVTDRSVLDLKAVLKAVRIRIELLEGRANKGPDKELQKRLKRAKSEELREPGSVEIRGEPLSSNTTPSPA